jgi:hypothetical protein
MGVRVVAADLPLPEDMRRTMQLVGAMPEPKVMPTFYDAAVNRDAAPFDSVPGAGFDTDAAAVAIVPPPGGITGSGSILIVDPAQNNSFRAINTAWRQGAAVSRTGSRFAISGLPAAAQDELVKALALQAERAATAGDPMKKPRLGLYQPWTGSMDEGWTRWVLEQYGFSFTVVHPEDFKAPLADKVDILIVADDARVPIEGAVGGRGGRGAPPRPEHAYQLTAGDVQRFEQFIRGGGTLVCLSNASAFAIQQFKLPVRNVVAGFRPEEFFLRGSIVQVAADTTHPVMAGMPDKAAIFVDGSPVFETQDGFTGSVLARYQETGSPLLSGYLIGEKQLNGRAAALDVQLGEGHVVLLGFRPQWRGQPFGTFRVLFNAALYTR